MSNKKRWPDNEPETLHELCIIKKGLTGVKYVNTRPTGKLYDHL